PIPTPIPMMYRKTAENNEHGFMVQALTRHDRGPGAAVLLLDTALTAVHLRASRLPLLTRSGSGSVAKLLRQLALDVLPGHPFFEHRRNGLAIGAFRLLAEGGNLRDSGEAPWVQRESDLHQLQIEEFRRQSMDFVHATLTQMIVELVQV